MKPVEKDCFKTAESFTMYNSSNKLSEVYFHTFIPDSLPLFKTKPKKRGMRSQAGSFIHVMGKHRAMIQLSRCLRHSYGFTWDPAKNSSFPIICEKCIIFNDFLHKIL